MDIINACNHHLISAGFIFECISKPALEKSSLDVDGENLLNDSENVGQEFSFLNFTDKEVQGCFVNIRQHQILRG